MKSFLYAALIGAVTMTISPAALAQRTTLGSTSIYADEDGEEVYTEYTCQSAIFVDVDGAANISFGDGEGGANPVTLRKRYFFRDISTERWEDGYRVRCTYQYKDDIYDIAYTEKSVPGVCEEAGGDKVRCTVPTS